MSHENTMCYWTAVPRAATPPGHVVPYWYVMDNAGRMDFTQDVANAAQFNIDSPYDKGAINEVLKERGLHMTMQAGPRLSLDGLEFSIDEYSEAETEVAEQETVPELTVDIRGRHDAVLILARLIGQNHMLLLGSEQKEISTAPLEMDTDGMRYTRVTIRIN